MSSGNVTVTGDPTHPANFGRLCSKGSALADTLDLDGRLLAPVVNGQETSWDAALGGEVNLVANRVTVYFPGCPQFGFPGPPATDPSIRAAGTGPTITLAPPGRARPPT